MGFHAQVKVRFNDVDNAGIVYYPRFFNFFHVAFEELFSERFGVPYVHLLNDEHLGFPSVRVETDFKSPLRFGDLADVEVGVERIGTKSLVCTYRLTKLPGKELCAVGKVTVAAVRVGEPEVKAIDIPEKYRALFAALMAEG